MRHTARGRGGERSGLCVAESRDQAALTPRVGIVTTPLLTPPLPGPSLSQPAPPTLRIQAPLLLGVNLDCGARVLCGVLGL